MSIQFQTDQLLFPTTRIIAAIHILIGEKQVIFADIGTQKRQASKGSTVK